MIITKRFIVEVDIKIDNPLTVAQEFEMASNIDLGIRKLEENFGITPTKRYDAEVQLIRVKCL